MTPWFNPMKGIGTHAGKGGPPGMWYYYQPGTKGQGGGKSHYSKGKGKGAGGNSSGEPAVAELATANKGLLNTVEQLREANKMLRAAAASGEKGPLAKPQPKAKAVAPSPVALDTKAPWACRTCGLDHHNGALKTCRACGAEREELSAPRPSPATVSARYWGPVHDKASQKLLKRLPMAAALLVTPKEATPATADEPMAPSQEEVDRQRLTAQKTVEFLAAQNPVNQDLLKSAQEALAALTTVPEPKTLDKPGQDRGLLIVLIDKQKAFNAEEDAKEAAATDVSCKSLMAAQEAHAELIRVHAEAALQRAAFVDALKATVTEVEAQCFHDCAETAAMAPLAQLAPAATQTTSKAEAAGLLTYLQQLNTSGVGPPPACVTLLTRLQLLAAREEDKPLDPEVLASPPPSPLQLPLSPAQAEGSDLLSSSAEAVVAAREQLAATKGANKGPHPLGKGTAVGHTPY